MMIEQLKRLMAEADPASKFDIFRLAADIRMAVDKELNGGFDRGEFERRLFAFGDMSQLAVGHLLDHRVRMPGEVATRLLAGDEGALSETLSKMLCSTHAQGAEMIAEALKLNPIEDARQFIDLHRSHPEQTVKLLSGDLEAALASSPLTSKFDNSTFDCLLVIAAIYYGALQLQIISVRQRAIELFQFGKAEPQDRSMGALDDKMRLILKTLEKARNVILSGKKPKGRPSFILSELKEGAEGLEKNSYVARAGLTETELLSELRDLYGYLSPRINLMRFNLEEADRKTPSASHDPKVGRRRSEMRMLVTTAVAGGVTGGEQIAFASLRLLSFSRQLPKIVSARTGWPKRHERWFGRLAGYQNKDAAKLILVSRSAVWITSQDPSAFSRDGRPYDLRNIFELTAEKGRVPGEDLIRTTKKMAKAWIAPDLVVSATAELEGSQLWDIQPEFHLGTAAPANVDAFDRSLTPNNHSLAKSHMPSPRYRAPRKSHHHF